MIGDTILPELSTWTSEGKVDMVAVNRVLLGTGDVGALTDAERTVVAHLMAEAGYTYSPIAERLHESPKITQHTLSQPAPVDRLGRPFHLTK